MTDIALFPIPSCVTFPGTLFPLHVFEPRYRQMIKHCVDNDMLLGVCHTQKVLHEAKEGQSVEEALKSNQATYKPFSIFSAGYCELKQILDDGRMLVNVHLKARYEALEEVQTLPFSIFRCAPFEDEEERLDDNALTQLKEKVMMRLQAITAGSPEVQAVLSSDIWQNKAPIDFSFELFGMLRLDPSLQQSILEMRSASARLETVLKLLNEEL